MEVCPFSISFCLFEVGVRSSYSTRCSSSPPQPFNTDTGEINPSSHGDTGTNLLQQSKHKIDQTIMSEAACAHCGGTTK